jgi:hypothetical protein
VIPPEQLAGALERLDPRERELLALSLRRRVPDEALARVYDVIPQEVARRRAAAIERLADELGAQRGEDLGAVLQALLDEGTWTAGEASDNGDPASAPESDPGSEEVTAAEEVTDAEEVTEAEELTDAEEVTRTEEATEAQPDGAAVAVEEGAPVVPVPSEPVLEMLAAREGVRGPAADGSAEEDASPRRGLVVAVAVASFVAAVIGGAAAFVGLSQWDDSGGGGGGTSAAQPPNESTKHFVPQLGGPFEAPFPSEPEPMSCFSTAYASGRTTLYKRPGGAVRIKLSARTEWGSPRIFGVVRRRGDWISVEAPELENGEVAWIEASRTRLDCVHWSMRVNLRKRRLYVQHNGSTVRRFQIAVGREGNPTPRGRFSVTDKLRVTDPGSPYGCCVLALSGHQTHLPASWPGGDRLAVHATRELSSLGKAASLGCMRVTSSQARWLLKSIPLGTPLFVKA